MSGCSSWGGDFSGELCDSVAGCCGCVCFLLLGLNTDRLPGLNFSDRVFHLWIGQKLEENIFKSSNKGADFKALTHTVRCTHKRLIYFQSFVIVNEPTNCSVKLSHESNEVGSINHESTCKVTLHLPGHHTHYTVTGSLLII